MTHFLYVTHIIMAAKFIHYGGQITYTTYIYIYILKIFYGVNTLLFSLWAFFCIILRTTLIFSFVASMLLVGLSGIGYWVFVA
jgi:hypothetical protein